MVTVGHLSQRRPQIEDAFGQQVGHVAAAVNKYGDVNIVNRRSSLDQTDVNISLNYIYTFSLLELKKKGTEKK